jgi:hypothetical protein
MATIGVRAEIKFWISVRDLKSHRCDQLTTDEEPGQSEGTSVVSEDGVRAKDEDLAEALKLPRSLTGPAYLAFEGPIRAVNADRATGTVCHRDTAVGQQTNTATIREKKYSGAPSSSPIVVAGVEPTVRWDEAAPRSDVSASEQPTQASTDMMRIVFLVIRPLKWRTYVGRVWQHGIGVRPTLLLYDRHLERFKCVYPADGYHPPLCFS